MILTDNRNYLRIHNRSLMEKLAEREAVNIEKSVVIEPSKKGTPTLKFHVDGKFQYVHSKYDPETEAELLIQSVEYIDKYEHVLFIGVGLGYQVKALLKAYPNMKFSIYEPDLDVLYTFLAHQNLTELPVKRLLKIFSTTDDQQLRTEIAMLNESIQGKTYIFTMPVYEKIYVQQVKIAAESFVQTLKEKRMSIGTDFTFQKRWTLNSIKNFSKILETPNILHDVDKNAFQGKSAILVSAGPSLNEEFENLKYIKEHGLAYIFAVGGSLNAQLSMVYFQMQFVYMMQRSTTVCRSKVKNNGISNVPLVFEVR